MGLATEAEAVQVLALAAVLVSGAGAAGAPELP